MDLRTITLPRDSTLRDLRRALMRLPEDVLGYHLTGGENEDDWVFGAKIELDAQYKVARISEMSANETPAPTLVASLISGQQYTLNNGDTITVQSLEDTVGFAKFIGSNKELYGKTGLRCPADDEDDESGPSQSDRKDARSITVESANAAWHRVYYRP